jgi:hypothetical protein
MSRSTHQTLKRQASCDGKSLSVLLEDILAKTAIYIEAYVDVELTPAIGSVPEPTSTDEVKA